MNIGKYVELVGELFEAAYVVDQQRTILFWNESAEKLTGYKASMVVGKKCNDNIMVHINEQGEKLCMTQCPLKKAITEGQKTETVFYLHHKTGYRIPVDAKFIPISNDNGEVMGAIEIFTKKEQEDEKAKPAIIKELIKVAYIDSVTNIPNKEYMENKIKKILSQSAEKPSEFSLGLLVVEIQNLRDFNNLGGMAAGNLLLNVVANTLKGNIEMEAGSYVCRWHGGLFVVLLNTNRTSTILNWANKLKVLVEKSNVLGYEEENIKVNIGVIATQPGEAISEVLKRLDSQLQASKSTNTGISLSVSN